MGVRSFVPASRSIATPELEGWFAAELARAYALPPTDEPGLLLGCPVWGDKFVALFQKFCLPSLLAPANAAALRGNDALVVLFTDADSQLALWRAVLPLERAGIRYRICPLPAEVLAGEHDLHKLMVLSAVHNLLIQWAKRSGRSFHPLCPDHCYSETFFEGLGPDCPHEAIALGAVSIDIIRALAAFRPFVDGAALAVPARALGDIGRRHLHQQMTACRLAAVDAPLPRSQTLIWESTDALVFAGPIFNPVWLSPRLCCEAPVMFPVPVDAALPALIPGDFHVPGPDEGRVLVECSTKAKAATGTFETLEQWQNFAWLQMNYDSDALRFYRRPTLIPTEANPEGLPLDAIERHHAALVEGLPAVKAAAMEAYMELTTRNSLPFLR
jgi:hypothetical protein